MTGAPGADPRARASARREFGATAREEEPEARIAAADEREAAADDREAASWPGPAGLRNRREVST